MTTILSTPDGARVHMSILASVAQDFPADVGLGCNGVALAAIQGVNQKLTEELKRRDAENAELKQRLEALEKTIRNQNSN